MLNGEIYLTPYYGYMGQQEARKGLTNVDTYSNKNPTGVLNLPYYYVKGFS